MEQRLEPGFIRNLVLSTFERLDEIFIPEM